MFARSILTLTAALTLAACSNGTGPRPGTCAGNAGPPGPATVAGCWVQVGVDTYTELDLAQNGTAISGTVSFCGALSGCTSSSQVTGTLLSPRVVLQWTQQGANERTDATLVSTADTLSNDTTFTAGGPGIHTGSFVRRTWR
jgi:hypothetical protein